MHKKTIISIIVLILIVIGISAFVKKGEHYHMPTQTVSATYFDGNSTVKATFDNKKDTVMFTHPAVGTVTLPHAVAASGARYANKDESIVFWEHQGEVTITKNGTEVFKGAKVNANESASSVSASPATILGIWVWEKTAMMNGSAVTPKQANKFTISFTDDGRVSGTTDCNSFSGSYTKTISGGMSFSPLASTKMFCPDSQEMTFTNALANVRGYTVSAGSASVLVLDLKDGGKMYFRKP